MARLQGVVIEVAGPDDLRAEEAVEEHVSRGHRRGRTTGQDHRARQAEFVGRRGGHAHMIGLAAAAGDQGVAALSEGLGGQVFELARLVAASGQAGAVISLDPQHPGAQPDRGRQPIGRFERGGQMGEVDLGAQPAAPRRRSSTPAELTSPGRSTAADAGARPVADRDVRGAATTGTLTGWL